MATSSEFLQSQSSSGLLASVVGGLLCGALAAVFAVSYSALVFSGPLAPYLGVGLGMALFGAMLHATVLAGLGSYPGTVGGVSAETAILGVIVAGLAARPGMSETPETLLAVVVVIVAGASLVTGAVCLGLGRAHLGNVIRYIPYPVMGGFVAGVGWLLLEGGLRLALPAGAGPASLANLLQPEVAQHWAPALLAALALLLHQRRDRHMLGVPAMVAVLGAGVYAMAWHAGLSPADLADEGWLLGPLSGEPGWSPLRLAESLQAARWSLVVDALPGVATFAVTTVMGLLLVGAALESLVRQDVELNRELRAAGWANIAAAAAGAFPGYHYIGSTSLNHLMGANRRLVGVVAGGVCLLLLTGGMDLIGLLPRMVAAGLLFFIGLDLLLTWLAESLTRLAPSDYLVVVIVFACVLAFGFMEGVLVGVMVGTALFALNYSRIDVVKSALSASSLRSSAMRPGSAQRVLRKAGSKVPVYRLEGFIFFGTVNRLLERIRARASLADDPLHTVVLDFRNVRGLDSSAAMYFGRLSGLAERRGFNLAVASLSPALWRVFEREGLRRERRLGAPATALPRERRLRPAQVCHDRVLMFATLDQALEWCEDRLLEESGFDESVATIRSIEDAMRTLFADRDISQRFLSFGESAVFEPGEILTAQGAAFTHLHFLRCGEVSVSVRTEHGQDVRLRKMGAGSSVGEISMYLGGTATARVMALTRTETLSFSRASLDRMRRQAPDVYALLHQALAHTLAARLADTSRVLDILLH